jgi:DNA-binding CsgD family transcriptional regulator
VGEAALGVAEAVGEPRLLALAHWNLAHVHEIGGDLDRSAHHAEEAERLARVAGEPDVVSRSLQVLAQITIWRGRYGDAERFAGEALALARAGHDALALAAAHWRLGVALGELGRYQSARDALLAGVTGAEAAGERYYLAKLLNTLGWLHVELGDPETALGWDRRALEAARGTQAGRVTEAERYALLNLATDELVAGRPAAAAEHLMAFAPLLEQHEYGRFRYFSRYLLLRAEVALTNGEAEAALGFAGEAAELATSKDMLKNLAKGRLLVGRANLALALPREATAALLAAVALADRMGHGSLRWQARFWLGRACAALRQDAAEHYRVAWEHLAAIAAGLDDDDRRRRFLAAPLARQVHAAAFGELATPDRHPAGLTNRELDVLRLLAQHQTDKEIAAALFLSPRTVSGHVVSIFNKLAVANRREAAAAAARLGIR